MSLLKIKVMYLIAHKVRGEPAFDIAEKLQIGDEEGWIIPTSGHRAYPYWHCPLREYSWNGWNQPGRMPPNLRDHYTVTRAVEPKVDTRALLQTLGLIKPQAPMNRRI